MSDDTLDTYRNTLLLFREFPFEDQVREFKGMCDDAYNAGAAVAFGLLGMAEAIRGRSSCGDPACRAPCDECWLDERGTRPPGDDR